MNRKKIIMLGSLVAMLSFLPGCRYYCWLKDVYNQGHKEDTCLRVAEYHWRATHVYDQLSPLAHFDVLWLSDELRMAYVHIHAQKHCMCAEHVALLKEQELDKNKSHISFYVLTAITPYYGHEDLAHKNSEWSMRLVVGNACVAPVKIEEVELPSEYKMFFGKKHTRFKRSYKVDFPAGEASSAYYLCTGTRSLQLHFHRDDRSSFVEWCLDGRGKVIRALNNDPDVLSFPFHIP